MFSALECSIDLECCCLSCFVAGPVSLFILFFSWTCVLVVMVLTFLVGVPFDSGYSKSRSAMGKNENLQEWWTGGHRWLQGVGARGAMPPSRPGKNEKMAQFAAFCII